jgi:hypothetical protein
MRVPGIPFHPAFSRSAAKPGAVSKAMGFASLNPSYELRVQLNGIAGTSPAMTTESRDKHGRDE